MIWDIVIFLLQAALAFVVSTALFDALHWVLHRWESSTISSRQRNRPSARIVALCAAPRSSTTHRPPVCRRCINE